MPWRLRRTGTSCGMAPRRPSGYTSSNVISHRICSRVDSPQPRRNATKDSRRGTLPAVIRLCTVAREMGVPASRLRRATLSKEHPLASINARMRRANSTGVAAPTGSAGTVPAVAALISLLFGHDSCRFSSVRTRPIFALPPVGNKNAIAYYRDTSRPPLTGSLGRRPSQHSAVKKRTGGRGAARSSSYAPQGCWQHDRDRYPRHRTGAAIG
jgi:hypothetical protein